MFITALDEHYEAQNLYHRLSTLTKINPEQWNETYQDEYNKCDEQHIIGMLAAEKKMCKVKTTAWSPTYSKAVESEAFWKIALSLKKNTHTKPHQKSVKWAITRNIYEFGKIGLQEIQLRKAQKELREIKQKAILLRENHLRDLINIQVESGDDKEHEKWLKIILHAQKRQYQYKKIQ
jgi:hypothetical protein